MEYHYVPVFPNRYDDGYTIHLSKRNLDNLINDGVMYLAVYKPRLSPLSNDKVIVLETKYIETKECL